MRVKNKVTIITGGGKGLGREIAEVLADAGHPVFICGREKRSLRQTCEKIRKNGGVCEYLPLDIARKTGTDAIAHSMLRRFGRIDVLVNNAGWCGKPKPLEKVRDSEYERYFATNVRSAFWLMRRIIPLMRKQRSGIIVNISSTAGHRANSILPIYSATKFALRALTQAVGKDAGKRAPLCVSVSPGGMNTAMRRALFGKKDADTQQSPAAVADSVKKIINGEVSVPNGGDVMVRDGKIVSVTPPS
ncbi:MAG: SDR family oxidoreductase [Candidatus Sungbacteria bacterium]|nr:SDR family oxidoreductase [Candidatus Sungbacteria bacterium]